MGSKLLGCGCVVVGVPTVGAAEAIGAGQDQGNGGHAQKGQPHQAEPLTPYPKSWILTTYASVTVCLKNRNKR